MKEHGSFYLWEGAIPPTYITNLKLYKMDIISKHFDLAKEQNAVFYVDSNTKNYDDNIGTLWCSLLELKKFAIHNEPSQLPRIQKLIDGLDEIDEFMAFGKNL